MKRGRYVAAQPAPQNVTYLLVADEGGWRLTVREGENIGWGWLPAADSALLDTKLSWQMDGEVYQAPPPAPKPCWHDKARKNGLPFSTK